VTGLKKHFKAGDKLIESKLAGVQKRAKTRASK